MSATSDFYLACAEKSRREATESTLDNVRERCLRSAAAWQAMAERAQGIEEGRQARSAATPPAPITPPIKPAIGEPSAILPAAISTHG